MAKQQPLCGGIIRAPRYFWVYAFVLHLSYGFFKEMKPAEAYITAFLTNATDGKNISVDVVNNVINPYWTYSYLVTSFIIFMLTDLLRYNPVIIIECSAYLSTRILAIWGKSVFAMQMMQVSYGIATGAEVGYFSYVYAVVPLKYYEQLTGPVRAARVFGRSISCFVGQALFSFFILDYTGMCYFSLVSVCIAMVIALLLPWYFSSPWAGEKYSQDLYIPKPCTHTIKQKFINQFHDFVKFYSQLSLLKWSVWWATAMCGLFQFTNYAQSLWEVVADEAGMPSGHQQWNGLVVGIISLGQTLAALATSFLRVDWSLWGELTMGGLALMDSALLLLASQTKTLWIAYGCSVVFISSQSFMITISSSQIAVNADFESYGLIFGFNTFLALVLQTILTSIVCTWLQLHTRLQFVVEGFYYYAIAMLFVFAGVYKLTKTGWFHSISRCCRRSRPPSDTPTHYHHPVNGSIQHEKYQINNGVREPLLKKKI